MEKPRKGVSRGRILVYADSFKITVAKDYLEGEYSLTQVGGKYNLPKDTISYFVAWYRKKYPSVPVEPTIVLPISDSKEDLAKELARTRLKLTAMEMMISNYEKETGVDLIKKSGSKRSAK